MPLLSHQNEHTLLKKSQIALLREALLKQERYQRQFATLKAQKANAAAAQMQAPLKEMPITTTHVKVYRGRSNPGVTVFLEHYGGHKIASVKALRGLTGYGLREAKELCESAPAAIAENLSESEAREWKEKLTQAGASVR